MAWNMGLLGAAAGGGEVPSGFDLLETVEVSTPVTSIDLTGLSAYATDYEHLQLRMALIRDQNATSVGNLDVRFNSDNGNSYVHRALLGYGSVVSKANTSDDSIVVEDSMPARTQNGNAGIVIMDILDFASTNKYKTTLAISGGLASAEKTVGLQSGQWRNTSAISSINLPDAQGYYTGTRVSLYGLKGA